ncbi:unnamed protein product [Closterium sp. NIES-54]
MSSSSGLTFKLHPLVIVNMSDHYTRVKAQQGGLPSRVVGCLLGMQSGRVVEIFNSFEVIYEARGGDGAGSSSNPPEAMDGGSGEPEIVIDRSFLAVKMEQYKKVFPKYDVLGWYSTGTDVRPADMHVHKALMDINESPIYLLLNPAINPAGKDLPISIFESELHVIDGVPSLIFVSSTYTIETVEAERISVDHVAHIKPSDGSSAATHLAAHLTGMHSAIKMLTTRVRLLHSHLAAMESGKPRDNPAQTKPNLSQAKPNLSQAKPNLSQAKPNLSQAKSSQAQTNIVQHPLTFSFSPSLPAPLPNLFSQSPFLHFSPLAAVSYRIPFLPLVLPFPPPPPTRAVPYDHSVTRQVSSLIRRLPAVDSDRFHRHFLTEFNDTLLMTYLASITKSTNTINELVDLFDVVYDKQSRRAARTAFV